MEVWSAGEFVGIPLVLMMGKALRHPTVLEDIWTLEATAPWLTAKALDLMIPLGWTSA